MPQHTVLENKDNCETYYICENKAAVLQKCPLGQYYNSQINACIEDVTGVCLMKPTIAPGVAAPINYLNKNTNKYEANLCAQRANFESFPNQCNTFYICIDGKRYEQECPQGFYYDSDKKYCLIDTNNKCSTDVVSKSI